MQSENGRPFYRGETIDLVVPTLDHVENSAWADWFNSQQTARYTNHGIYPNTVDDQRAFFASLNSGGRLALLIVPKDSDVPVGTVSLSGIDFRTRVASIAIIMDTETSESVSVFASLEAIAILTQHAFDVLGLVRIESGQAYPALARWNQLLELLGYRTEGIKRDAFARGHVVTDGVLLACLYSNYLKLVEARGGSLWPGTRGIVPLVRALPKKPFAELVDESIRAIEREYFGE